MSINRPVGFAWLMLAFLLTSPVLAGDEEEVEEPDPKEQYVPLSARAGWQANLVVDYGETGVWCVKQVPFFGTYAVDELIGLDDLGRCNILVSYSGKWTPKRTIEEGRWLGCLWHGDLDPRAEGAELYTGGALGNLYQVRAYPFGLSDHRLIAQFPGMEIHTVIGGELDPRVSGSELLVFTRPGALYRVRPTGEHGSFEQEKLMDLPGRIRDAVAIPSGQGFPDGALLTTTRAGHVGLVTIDEVGAHYEMQWKTTTGLGRLSLRKTAPGDPLVAYVGLDDGRVQRLQYQPEDEWSVETIYRGPMGVRGVAAGRFDENPATETVAVFGYSGKVQLLTRAKGQWTAETLFVDRDKGHWLSACEVDARNNTDELVGSGYGGRVFVLRRPVGYGFDDQVPGDPDPDAAESREQSPGASPEEATIAVFAGSAATERLDPLSYRGGFEAKTLVYETLLRRDDQGRLRGQLADHWSAEEGGRVWTFRLRKGASWSNDKPVIAEEVAMHFRRCAGMPEHAWLRGLNLVQSIRALDSRTVQFRLREPWYLPADLCAINPCAVRGPDAIDGEGEFIAPSGSGAWIWDEPDQEGKVLVFVARNGKQRIRLYRVKGSGDPWSLMKRGQVHAVVDGWRDAIPREEYKGALERPGWSGARHTGSSVWYLSFSLAGPSANPDLRRFLAGAIDREALVRDAEGGYAMACATWTAHEGMGWPSAQAAPIAEHPSPDPKSVLTLLVQQEDRPERLGRTLVAQFHAAGQPVKLVVENEERYRERLEQGLYDLRLEHTWGLPYDPDLSLQARFLPDVGHANASSKREYGVDPVLRACVLRASQSIDETERRRAWADFQHHMDSQASIIPLLVPDRLALFRADVLQLELSSDLYRWRSLHTK